VKVEDQIAIIYCGTKGLLKDVPVKDINKFEEEYIHLLQMRHQEILTSLREGKLTDSAIKVMEETANDLAQKFIRKGKENLDV